MRGARKLIVGRLMCVLGLAVFLVWAAQVHATLLDDIKREIQQKEEEIRQLETEKKQFEGTIAQKQKSERTLKNQIVTLTTDIARLKTQLAITAANVQKTGFEIKSLEEEIRETNERIATHKSRMYALVRSMHENAEEHKTLFSLLLRQSAFSTFFAQLAYADTLEEELLERTRMLHDEHERLEADRTALNTKREELEELRERLAAENATKSSQQKKKSELLVVTKNEEKKYKQLLTEAEKKRQDILKEIKELEDKLRRTIDPASIPAYRPGVIEWPAKGILSQGYGDTKDTGFQNDAYEFHNGIDIANDVGTPIKAAREGVVKAVGNNSPYAYGKWIAVEHDNNLTTLYAHLSGYAAAAKQGSAVKKGQVIGYMGATGFATGSHLHFTVYASNTFITEKRWFGLLPLGGSINPMKYLP